MIDKLREEVYNLHDVEVNQKYDGLPYSFHLKIVEKQFDRFNSLLPQPSVFIANLAIITHDVLEDARLTYNDVIKLVENHFSYSTGVKVAEIVYLVTDFKGRTRAERKPDLFYEELFSNKIALFVKLCDMIANKYYSTMSNSSMKEAYVKEYEKFKSKCYYEPYKEMFETLENIK